MSDIPNTMPPFHNPLPGGFTDVNPEQPTLRDYFQPTLRDYFAAAALTGFVAEGAYVPDGTAKAAYEMADAMLEARKQ